MTALAEELADERRREFRHLLWVSVVAHVAGILLFGLSPSWSVRSAGPEVIAVDLVMAPTPARTRPAPPAPPAPSPPAPAEAPAPAPPVPVKKQVVLPKEPTAPEPEPKPAPRPRPQRRELDPSELQKPAPVEDYEDVMAKLRAEAGEPRAEPTPEPVQVARAEPAPAGGGARVSPEVAAWIRRAKIHVRRSWVVPPGFRTQPLETRVKVRLDAGGAVLGEPDIVRRSGNPWYDDGVVRGIQKASPLPPPPEAGEWEFVFVPEDSY